MNPKHPTTLEEMGDAYHQAQKNISNFEAKILAPAIVTLLAPYVTKPLYESIGNWAIPVALLVALSNNIPADLNFRKCRSNESIFNLYKSAFRYTSTLGLISSIGGARLDRFIAKHNIAGDLAMMRELQISAFAILANHLFQFDGDSVVSKTYRVAKGSMAALVPMAKKTLQGIEQKIFRSIFGELSFKY